MLEKEFYTNGQKIYELADNQFTFFYKNGTLKAAGAYIDGKMEGEWLFYRENGQLWQTGNFKNNEKHGAMTRYDKAGKVEYHKVFENGKVVK